MRDTNVVVLVGRLARDGEYKMSISGKPVLKFSVASNNDYGEKKHCNFIDCHMFGDRVTKIQSYFTKGRKVAVQGNLHHATWESDGRKMSKIEINVDDVQFLEPQKQDEFQPVPQPADPNEAAAKYKQFKEEQKPSNDEIPF